MATLSDFTPEEVKELQTALGYVVTGAVMSEPGGPISIVREMMGGMSATGTFLKDARSPLLAELLRDVDKPDKDEVKADYGETPDIRQKAMDLGIESATKAHDLLKSKADAGDADEYAQMMLIAANAAVKAAKTGSFLGFGGEQVTPSEEAYVQRLSDALGYSKSV